MNQPKVFEFAKEVGLETLALMDKIREWKLPVKSHMAELDEALMEEIKKRLSGEDEAKPAAKKKVTRKAAPKKEAAAKTVAKPAKVAKTTKSASADAAEAGEVKPKATRKVAKKAAGKTVIRRKAGEAEAKAEAEAEALRLHEEAMAQAVAQAIADGMTPEEAVVMTQEAAAQEAQGEVLSPTTEGAAEAPRRPRNIVGRMDLRRVAPGTDRSGGAAGNAAGGAAGRPATRAVQRNIRTGFVAAPNMGFVPPPVEEEDHYARKEREEKAKKKAAGAGGGREEVAQNFSATEFRKREVIFQPKKKKQNMGRDTKKTSITTPKAHKRIVKVYGSITVNDLAQQMGLKAPALIKKLMTSGVQASMNSDLDFDTVSLVVPDFGFEAQNIHKTESELLENLAFGDLKAERVTRPPVVTVMGHVDHGKTTLLDSIRKANVASGEAGGITQHIGAYSVQLENGRNITFIDTPGHEAFTAMRARGANVTDVAIIVVAADDGMMPQTAEAINHAKAANVPIIVAVNKMDKQGANPDKIKQQLTEFELVPEEWGGTTIFAEVSALKGQGIPELLESILLSADILELKANPMRSGTGLVIESRMEKGRGPVATVLVQDGSIEIGQIIVAGTKVGRIRSMMNDKGETVKKVGPGFPAEIMGLSETPEAGDRFDICADESVAARVIEERKAQKVGDMTSGKMTLEEIMAKVKAGAVKELSVVLKADVAGSLEAVKAMLEKSGSEEVKVKLIHTGVGGISESDILLASTGNGMAIGFNVRPDGGAQRMAKEKGIEIKTYSIIYELIDDMKKILGGLLAPEIKEVAQGRAEVRDIFTVPKIGTIAGCAVVDGKIARNHMLRLVRDGRVVYEGKVSSLKRFKDDAKEVASGYECGIGIENFNDIKSGDVIESFIRESIVREL